MFIRPYIVFGKSLLKNGVVSHIGFGRSTVTPGKIITFSLDQTVIAPLIRVVYRYFAMPDTRCAY